VPGNGSRVVGAGGRVRIHGIRLAGWVILGVE
jgi:hypothetical protein